MSNSSIWPIDKTLSGVTTLNQNEPESDSTEGVLCIPQTSTITETSQSDCLMLYTGHLLNGRYLNPLQSVYSTAPALDLSEAFVHMEI